VLTVDTIPLSKVMSAECRVMNNRQPVFIHHSALCILHLLRFLVSRMATAATAELPELKSFRRRLLILRRHVVAVLALGTLQHNVVARHNSPSKISTINTNQFNRRRYISCSRRLTFRCYSMMSETVPAPTVLPPSRMANLKPFSKAIGVINSISIATLSPGITISTPSGKCATPVTSVVRK
jgi:hypothetical protein